MGYLIFYETPNKFGPLAKTTWAKLCLVFYSCCWTWTSPVVPPLWMYSVTWRPM